jgi:hypothetical protein
MEGGREMMKFGLTFPKFIRTCSLITKFISIFFYIFFVVPIAGCGNKFEECVQNQQEEYRREHPDASYSEVSRLRSGYEALCSSLKK